MTPQPGIHEQLSYAGLSLGAALVAAPAVVLAGVQYGWAGLAVAGAYVGVIQPLAIHFHAIAQKLGKNFMDFDPQSEGLSPVSPTHPLQKLADQPAQTMNVAPLQVYKIDDDDLTVVTNMKCVLIARRIAQKLSDRELTFVFAHETHHRYQPIILEPVMKYTVNASHGITLVSGLMAIATVIPNMLQTGNSPLRSAFAIGAASLVSMISTQFAARYPGVSVEYRCDENALLTTGDLEAATMGLMKVSDVEPGTLHSVLNIIDETLFAPWHSHPTLGGRIRHLENVHASMRGGAPGHPAPVA